MCLTMNYVIQQRVMRKFLNILLESATIQKGKSRAFKFKNGIKINIVNPTASK